MNHTVALRNIRLLLAFRFLAGTGIFMPVIVLSWQQNGLTQSEIFWTQAAFAIAILVMEVPSGWLADRFKRKYSLVTGALLIAISFVVYAQADGFWAFVVAEVIGGIGASFVSGADSALACDSLLAAGLRDRYRKFEARAMTLASVGGLLASLAGGLIAAQFDVRTTLILQVPVEVAMLVTVLFLVEPRRLQPANRPNPVKSVLTVVRHSLHGHKEIKWLIIFGAILGTATHTVLWLYQPYYQLVKVPVVWFGVIAAGQYIATALMALLAERFEKLGRKVVFTTLLAVTVVSYVAMGVYPFVWLITAQLGFHFVRAVSDPILKDYVNQLVESNIRATVLSVKSLAQKLLYIGAGPLIGLVTDTYSLQVALLFSAALYGALGVFVLLAMRRIRLW